MKERASKSLSKLEVAAPVYTTSPPGAVRSRQTIYCLLYSIALVLRRLQIWMVLVCSQPVGLGHDVG